ncbi:MAG TPA: DUF4595 domain-containing protein [Chitinophagaceae bacterium]|nr:DUF4595 domain-containing protein [Chitinophagaceae bacterium]
MTTKKIITYVFVAAGIFFSACRKENAVITATAAPKKLMKSYSTAVPAQATNYTYDSKGRLIEQGSFPRTAKFDYTNNVFSGTTADLNNYVYYTWSNGQLDNAGRLLQVDVLYTPKNGTPITFKYVFTYNPEGYLIKMKNTDLVYNDVFESDYNYTNGNLTSIVGIYNGQPSYRAEFDYYDNLVNKFTVDITWDLFSCYTDGLTGKLSKNLVKEKREYNGQNVIQSDNQFQYQLDSEGYPVSFTAQNLLIANYQWGITFEYNK